MFSRYIAETDAGTPVPFWTIQQAKNGSVTASEDGALLHSSYDPERESQQAAQRSDFKSCTAAVFYSCGLGYTPSAYARLYPERTILIIEPEPLHFFAALTLTDWSTIFACPSCMIALGCPPETVIPLIERSGTAHCAFFSVPSQTAHARQYFETLRILVDRNRRKDDINTATLERFGRLWLRNSFLNIRQYRTLPGAGIYADNGTGLPFLILAAGPSLEQTLPHLSELKKRSVIVCVDTALRACLRTGVEPDFIVLADPQYYAYRHIAGLSSPSSVLITETAVYPAVYRFPCRRTVLCSSLYPLGKWFEQRFGGKGDLGAGGSVASSAWNFAYLAGGRELYTAGLDLSFPGRKTHIKGSTFEQTVHTDSTRTRTAECAGLPALFSAGAEYGSDYTGSPVLTDARMKLFAWWFESRLAACPGAQTYTFSTDGLSVPGIQPVQFKVLLSKPDIRSQKQLFFEQSEKNTDGSIPSPQKFGSVMKEFSADISALYDTAKKGMTVCETALASPAAGSQRDASSVLVQLADIDRAVQQNSLHDAAALVYSPEKLRDHTADDPVRTTLVRSRLMYAELCRILDKYCPDILK